MKLITGFNFKGICDYHYTKDEPLPDSSKLLVHCYGHDLQYLIEYCKTRPKDFFVIVSHNSDACIIPFKWREFDCFCVNLPDNIHIFGQNVDYFSDKITPIPIGLENENWHKGQKFNDINSLIYTKTNPHRLLYVNIETSTNPIDRHLCIELIKKQVPEATIINKKKQYKAYINDMRFHKFTACPDGNGFDCHRTWEALYMDSIPIVKNHVFTRYFKGLGFPMLVIDDWHEVTTERLNKEYKELKKDSTDLLSFDWWKDLIRKKYNEP